MKTGRKTKAAGLRVRTLDWDKDTGRGYEEHAGCIYDYKEPPLKKTRTIHGIYFHMRKLGDGYHLVGFGRGLDGKKYRKFKSLDSAKKTAQRDFEKYVLGLIRNASHLLEDPSPVLKLLK